MPAQQVNPIGRIFFPVIAGGIAEQQQSVSKLNLVSVNESVRSNRRSIDQCTVRTISVRQYEIVFDALERGVKS